MRLVGLAGYRGTLNFYIVLDEDAVVKDGDTSKMDEFSVLIEFGGMENDIVALPFARLTRSVDERRILAVNGRGLAIGISFIVVGIEDLNFVDAHQENATVAAILVLALGGRWRSELNVKLTIGERLFRIDVAGFRNDFEIAVADFPFCRFSGFCGPGGEIFAVEEDDGVGRSFAGSVLRGGDAGVNHGRGGAIAVVGFPLSGSLAAGGYDDE